MTSTSTGNSEDITAPTTTTTATTTTASTSAPPRVVVVMGAESTGTTTLAQALAKKYGVVCVPEYGRYYWEARQFLPNQRNTWTVQDFLHIQREQNRLEQQLGDMANQKQCQFLVCDTDCVATTVWLKFYMGTTAPENTETDELSGKSTDVTAATNADAKEKHDDVVANTDAVDGERQCRQLAQEYLAQLGNAAATNRRLYLVTRPDIPYEQVIKL